MAKAGRELDQHNASEGRHVTQPQPYHKCASSWQEDLAERCSVAETKYLTARFKLIEYDDPPIIERPVVKTQSRRAEPKPLPAIAPTLPAATSSSLAGSRTLCGAQPGLMVAQARHAVASRSSHVFGRFRTVSTRAREGECELGTLAIGKRCQEQISATGWAW
jgi:hypothetical protein